MNNPYPISSNDLPFLHAKSVLVEIEKVSQLLSIPYMIVGAFARDLLYRIHKKRLGRATQDIDFAIMLNDWEQFSELKNQLLAQGNFIASYVPHRLIFQADSLDLPIDVVPFGAIAEPDQRVLWPPNQEPIMSTLGFQSAYKDALYIELDQILYFPILSLTGFALLKLFAWEDRKERGETKDAKDLQELLKTYFSLEEAWIYDHYDDLVESLGDFVEEALYGPRILGWKMNQMLVDDPLAKTKVVEILQRETDSFGKLSLAMDPDPYGNYELNQLQLKELRAGLQSQTRKR